MKSNGTVEIDQNNLFQPLSNRNRTYLVEDITKCARSLDDKYAEQKELIKSLEFKGYVGLPVDEMAMALIPEDLPLQPEDHTVAVRTRDNGDCLYNAVSLALMSTESYASLLRLPVALELSLNTDYNIRHPRLTSLSSTDSHHPDTLFSEMKK